MGRRRCCCGPRHQSSLSSQSQSQSGSITSASSSSSQGRRGCPDLTCAGTGDNAPQVMKVVIAGVTNGSCSSCGNINGTYYLDNTGGTDLVGLVSICNWSIDIPEICTCAGATGYFRLQVQVGRDLGTNVKIMSGSIYGSDPATIANPLIHWQKIYSTALLNCCEFVDEDLPYARVTNCSGLATPPFTALCAGSASTFKVTSLGCP